MNESIFLTYQPLSSKVVIWVGFDADDIDNVRDTIVFQGYVPLFVIFSGYKNPVNKIIIEVYGGANLSISWLVLRHPNTKM